MNRKKVLVTGGRDYENAEAVAHALNWFREEKCGGGEIWIVEGGATTGADTLAREWAKKNQVWCTACHAPWRTRGRAAGPIRNYEMVQAHRDAVAIFVFPGGAGTKDCMEKAELAEIQIYVVKDPDPDEPEDPRCEARPQPCRIFKKLPDPVPPIDEEEFIL